MSEKWARAWCANVLENERIRRKEHSQTEKCDTRMKVEQFFQSGVHVRLQLCGFLFLTGCCLSGVKLYTHRSR